MPRWSSGWRRGPAYDAGPRSTWSSTVAARTAPRSSSPMPAVDIRERYPFTFADRQATTRREPLRAGDYGLLVDGLLQATVERTSLADLVTSSTTGKLKFQLTESAAVPRAAGVVEAGYSRVFKLDHVGPSVVADGIAECQVRFPRVPIGFCETRKLAQEWTYRFLAAARVGLAEEMVGVDTLRALETVPPRSPAPPTPADVRRWATADDIVVSDRGRIPVAVMEPILRSPGSGRDLNLRSFATVGAR